MPRSLASYARAGSDGHGWYDRASDTLRAVAERYGAEHRYVCGLCAVLSPRIQLRRNMVLLCRALASGEPPDGILRSVRVATERYMRTGEIRGPKTEAFARALRGDEDAVVLDVWLARALGREPSRGWHRAAYDRDAARVTRAARRYGASPREFQAMVWLGCRRARGWTKMEHFPADIGDLGE